MRLGRIFVAGDAVPSTSGEFLWLGTASPEARRNFCGWGRRPQYLGGIFVVRDGVPGGSEEFLWPGMPSPSTSDGFLWLGWRPEHH